MARPKPVSSTKANKRNKKSKKSHKGIVSTKRAVKSIETEDECGSSSTYRQLLKFKKVEDILYLASRIFQKEPQIYEGVVKSRESAYSKSEEASWIRQQIFSTINEIVREKSALTLNRSAGDSSKVSLPRQWENYIAFCDLVFAAKNISNMSWSTFIIHDYDKTLHVQPGTTNERNIETEVERQAPNEHDSSSKKRHYLPVHKIRKRLKKIILRSGACDTEDEESEGNILASVQVDTIPIPESAEYDSGIDSRSTCEEMVMIRVVSTRKTRNMAKDRNNLLTRKSTIIAYFPGEPYFYCATAKPNAKYCQALVECLHGTKYFAIPLSDRDVFSLRRLRLNRDTLYQNNNIMSSILDEDLIGYYNEAVLSRYAIDGEPRYQSTSDELDEQSHSQLKLPLLKKFQINYISKYLGKENAFRSKEKTNNSSSQKADSKNDLSINVQFAGNDILNAFSSMAQFSVANSSQPKYFEQPLPKWVKESACRGRNTRTIKNKSTWQPQVDELGGEELDQDDDAMSIAASEMTNWGGTNKIFRTPFSHIGLSRNES